MNEPRASMTFHDCLGEGGVGEVYLATQNTQGTLQRQVAVKILREGIDEDSDAVKRLRDEGQALALLAHPAILGVHEFAKVDGRLALVMEYVEGADISIFCDPDHLLPQGVALEVAREVAEALHHAVTSKHPMTGRPLNLIHRDIKPANIRITIDGSVRLLDFGVARTEEMDRKASTQMGNVLLTSGFAAPETLAFGVSSPAGDVFALGVTLFQLLTGRAFYDQTLGAQVQLALDSEDYNTHLQLQLQAVKVPVAKALLEGMLRFEHELRPDAGTVADRAHQAVEILDDVSIGKWARSFDWPVVAHNNGALCGRKADASGNLLPEDPKPAVPPPEPVGVSADLGPPPAPAVSASISPSAPRVSAPVASAPSPSSPAAAPKSGGIGFTGVAVVLALLAAVVIGVPVVIVLVSLLVFSLT